MTCKTRRRIDRRWHRAYVSNDFETWFLLQRIGSEIMPGLEIVNDENPNRFRLVGLSLCHSILQQNGMLEAHCRLKAVAAPNHSGIT